MDEDPNCAIVGAMSRKADYVLGHCDFEVERLQVQAAAIAGVTGRFIREGGVQPGMTILDIGCGAGDAARGSR